MTLNDSIIISLFNVFDKSFLKSSECRLPEQVVSFCSWVSWNKILRPQFIEQFPVYWAILKDGMIISKSLVLHSSIIFTWELTVSVCSIH